MKMRAVNRRNLFSAAKFPVLLAALIFLISGTAEANWTKDDICTRCHTSAHSTASINVAIDAVEITSASIDNNGVDSFEIDWMFDGSTWTNNKESSGVMIEIPTGWTIESGTVNSPALTNWSSAWDNADGGLTWQLLTDSGSYCPANFDCYAIQFTGSWDHDTASENMACNYGGTACEGGAAGTDQDGVANSMGTDAVIKTSVDETAGAYTIKVYGIGYDDNSKANISETINVTVNTAPNIVPDNPSGLTQYKSDAVSGITQGTYTDESTIIIKATVSDGNSDDVKLEVEFATVGSAFTGSVTCSSTFVTSGTQATATCSGLADGVYKWRARANDNTDTGNWVEY